MTKRKNMLVGIAIITIYFLVNYCSLLPFNLMGVDINDVPDILKIIYNLSTQFAMIIVFCLLLKSELSQNIQDFKKNANEYFKRYFIYWIIGIGVMMISNLILIVLTGNETSGNEEAVREILTSYPVYMFISSVIVAPILEETVFRKSIRNIIRIDWLYIILSGFIFGSMHLYNVETWVDMLYIIPYSSLGIAFAYMLVKSNNILVPISFHLMHNGLLVSLQILLMIFN